MNKNAVIIHSSHRNEWQSKLQFEKLISEKEMYMPSEWTVKDYGIDGFVEIAAPVKNSRDLNPESLYFAVQLKSTKNIKCRDSNISFRIPVKKIIQWLKSNIPVLLVINDLISNQFYYLWIDDRVVNTLDKYNSNWMYKKTITIYISKENQFGLYPKEELKQYVINWRSSSRRIIKPGLYFELKEKCNDVIENYRKIGVLFKFESINNSIKSLGLELEQAIYRVAVTGPSRAGKSTLINALLRRKDISPTGFYQTTGVPIQLLPGFDEQVKIFFKDGRSKTSKYDFKIIEEYVSQEKNPENKKGVALFSILLGDKKLEHGLSFFDLPGLDDPNEEIYNFSLSTLKKANAVLYVIDASTALHGGFIFRAEYRKHIDELSNSTDKIFLVFNKINVLPNEVLISLKERVEFDLKRLSLFEKVHEKVYYISAGDSLEQRLKPHGPPTSLDTLEEDIWTYMLKESKLGLFNLMKICSNINKSCIDFEFLLQTRLSDNEKLKNLRNTIESVHDRGSELEDIYSSKKELFKYTISQLLDEKKNRILSSFEHELKKSKTAHNLPNKKQISDYLFQNAQVAIEETNESYIRELYNLKETVDLWIEKNLRQIRETISGQTEKKIVDFSDLEDFHIPEIDLASSFGIGIITGLIGLALAPGAAILTAISGFFANYLLSIEDLKTKKINRMVEEARRRYNSIFLKIETEYMNLIEEQSELIEEYANTKYSLFFDDLNIQIEQFKHPLSDREEQLYKQAFTDIQTVKEQSLKIFQETKSWSTN